MKETTIAAISTPLGAGGIGIVRISGPDALLIASRVFVPQSEKQVRQMKGYTGSFGKVYDDGEPLDEAVLFVYRAPKSYTGEEVAELSCHGGMYLLQRVLRAVLAAGAQLAQPGEFTKRAFLNGKLDLTEAEAVMDLISAQGRASARAALAVKEGAVFRRAEKLSEQLVELAGHLAAWVDYPEEDIAEVTPDELQQSLEEIKESLEQLLMGYDSGRVLCQGISTVILGRPNAGKSTLMNLLSGSERSIVTEIPGTTRDVVEQTVTLGDLLLNLADTAGLRETDDPVEQAGVERSYARLAAADLVLAVFDGSLPTDEQDLGLIDRIVAERQEGKRVVAVVNKSDLPLRFDIDALKARGLPVVVLSAKQQSGAAALEQEIKELMQLEGIDLSDGILANERQRGCVATASRAVGEALEALTLGVTLDAVSVCIDEALEALLQLTGKSVSTAVVEEVFSHFCVGK